MGATGSERPGSSVRAFVVEAELILGEELDPRSVGAAVTTELCGHWEHEGPCRWPHNNALHPEPGRTIFRTVFVAQADEEAMVGARIENSLRAGDRWTVLAVRARHLLDSERGLAGRLVAGPRQPRPTT
jgi:hypothetical protein